MLHNILYSHDSFEKIEFNNYIRKLTSSILNMYDKKFTLNILSNPIYLNSSYILLLGMITNELITNSIKHAFKDIEGEIEISLSRQDDHLRYRYKDNGQKKSGDKV